MFKLMIGFIDYPQPMYILKILILSQLAYVCSFILMLFMNSVIKYSSETTDVYIPAVMRQSGLGWIKNELL